MSQARNALPSQAELQRLLAFDPETGWLTWKVAPSPQFACLVGQRAGSLNRRTGYRVVQVKGVAYGEHRIIFKLATGDEPPEVDHKNRVRDDNRLCNLRAAWHPADNHHNTEERSNNAVGVRGVYHCKKRRSYFARFQYKGALYIKFLPTIEECSQWRAVRLQQLAGEWTNAAAPPAANVATLMAPRLRSTNSSGATGVSRCSHTGLWRAEIKTKTMSRRSRRFRTKEEAVACRKAWEAELAATTALL